MLESRLKNGVLNRFNNQEAENRERDTKIKFLTNRVQELEKTVKRQETTNEALIKAVWDLINKEN